ncbi:hypothetical protein [Devosia sp. CN2-171]|uniref:hypothetical protein n=1 Tax=Devosia sp. CN2-171 TaxID=3400909 RepID=UPI003BF85849
MFLARYFNLSYGRDEALEFFALFGRFEFALKRAGYLTDKADPNWDAFAGVIGDQFFKASRQRKEVDVLFRKPAGKLVQVDGVLEWKEMPTPTNGVELIVQVRRIRNNFFHGEKATMSQRDVELITAAGCVLEEAYYVAERCTEIAKYFEDYTPGGQQ